MRRTEVDNQANSGTVSRGADARLCLSRRWAAVDPGMVSSLASADGWSSKIRSKGAGHRRAQRRHAIAAMEAAKLYREGYAPKSG